MCELFISFLYAFKRNPVIAMVELRVTIDEKLNKLLDRVVESGVYQSKAELMRSATIYLLIQMGLISKHVKDEEHP